MPVIIGPAKEGSQGMDSIIGYQPGPDQLPQRIQRFAGKSTASCVMQVRKERGAAALKKCLHQSSAFRQCGISNSRRQQMRQVFGQIKRNAAVAFANPLHSDPDDFSRRH